MKKMLMAICAVSLSFLAWADTWTDPSTGITWTYTIIKYSDRDSEARVDGADPTEGDIDIPSVLGGHPVTSIGDVAFSECADLTGVMIPSGVTDIGYRTFERCSGLTNVTISSSVRNIGNYAFAGCRGLTSVTIPEGVTHIGLGAFSTCTGLEDVSIPSSLLTIEESVFSDCASLTNVTIPFGVTSIGYGAFHWCFGLTNVMISSSVTNIGDNAFSECSGLTNVTIPDGVTNIGAQAFHSCVKLSSVTIGSGVVSIGFGSFAYCIALETVDIPSGVESIGENAFTFSGLTSVEIPATVTIVGSQAFQGCRNLTSARMSSGLTEISRRMFVGCDGLVDVVIPLSVRSVGGEAFSGCNKLTAIDIPAGVTNISTQAFSHCNKLTSVTIPAGVLTIGTEAFRDCSNLDAIQFEGAPPDGVAAAQFKQDATIRYNIENKDEWEPVVLTCGWSNARPYYVTPLLDGGPYTEMVGGIEWTFGVQDGTACIGYGWQYRAVSEDVTGEITIPAELGGRVVRRLSVGAFLNCKKLTAVEIPSTVTTIEEGSFEHCNGLLSVELPAGLVSIGDYGFHDCSSLGAIKIPASVKIVGSCAFQGCTKLTMVGLSSGVTSIGAYAFKACGDLACLTMPASVSSVGENAFLNCSSLNALDFEGAPQTGVAAASVKTDAAIRYNVAYEAQWLPVITACGWTNAQPYTPSLPDGGPYKETVGGVEWTFMVTNGEASVGAKTSSGTAIPQSTVGPVVIPTTLGGRTVTGIGSSAFGDCRQLKGVTIPEGVTSIGHSAFYCTEAITELGIPTSVTNIEEGAFYACFGLKDIHVAEGNQCYVSVDGVLYTRDGTSLICCPAAKTSVSLLTSVTNICSAAFGECSGVESITLPPNLATLGNLVFYSCRVTTLTFPSSVIRVGGNMFPGCDCLETVYFEGLPPDNLNYEEFLNWQGFGKPKRVIAIRYNAAYEKEWQAIIKERGLTNAQPYQPEPSVPGDPGAVVSGDPESGYVIAPSEGKKSVEVTIPAGVGPEKVTVILGTGVETVKPNGAMVKIVKGTNDITDYLNVPEADASGTVDLTKAAVKEEIVKEALDPAKGAEIVLNAEAPSLTTAETKPGLTYTLHEGATPGGMNPGDSKLGDGKPWTPNITIKGGASGFYSIGVTK